MIHSNPYEKLVFHQNICEIRRLIVRFTKEFLRSHFRLASQMNDAARSAKQNVREGYRKDSAGEFGRYLKISAGSLDELEGDVDDCFEDNLILKKRSHCTQKSFRKNKISNG
ncbi:MAG: four helix bundle protein [Candidatus Delongbacteria bacterium]|jgi:four helix bundle protein|nr:four helix bundle protein [Candidatus Delongbacteria bacterium]